MAGLLKGSACRSLLRSKAGRLLPSERQQPGVVAACGDDHALRPVRQALVFVRQRHDGQFRKGTNIPYIAHLLSTAALVLEGGGDEEQAIAGLLHDTLEEYEVTKVTADDIVKEFGERVARLVQDCSDSEPGKKEDKWRVRKKRYLAALKTHDMDSLLVANADKLHNARAILADYRKEGEDLWSRFSNESDPLWYYPKLAKIFRKRSTPLASEFDRVVGKLVALVERTRRGQPE
ncbi:MAG: HD domain-containing protein [Acidimicrobiia bacterium]